jgi:mitochondrial fission protein ELM1
MEARGWTRPFDGSLAQWDYDPPDDTAKVAAEIQRRIAIA